LINKEISIKQVDDVWRAQYEPCTSEIYGIGDSPIEAITNFMGLEKFVEDDYEAEVGEDTGKKKYVKPEIRELDPIKDVEIAEQIQSFLRRKEKFEDLDADMLNRKITLKPMETLKKKNTPFDVVKNHVIQMMEKLGKEDICSLVLSTELYKKATSTGEDTKGGDEYLALCIRKINNVPEDYVLSESMIYPAKDIYDFSQKVK
jgi:hypothetical protein